VDWGYTAEYDRVALASSDELPDRLLTQLYGEDPADFVARRTAMVKELRGNGQPEVARKVAGLRRPTAGVWAANRLRDVAPEDLQTLIETGRRLREAQIAALEGRAVSDLRTLLSAHSASLQRAVDAAAGFLAARGQNASATVGQRLQTTLRAVSLGTPDLQAALAEGRLTNDLEPGGFSAFEGIELAPSPPAGPSPPARPAPPAPLEGAARRPVDPDLAARAEAARTAADARSRVAREAMEEARALRARAEQLAGEAEAAASEAAAAEARARGAADDAEATEREARQAEEAASPYGRE
jgi:hypothetical protein